VFDTGPLSHFARENWLGVLKAVVGSRTAMIPDMVVEELQNGARRDSRIQAALDASCIEHRELLDEQELESYRSFAELLVYRERNRGEAAVLALAATTNGIAVVDDGAGRRAAQQSGVRCKPTLSLLCDAIRQGLLTVPLVSALADDLLAGVYRLPFGPGGFEKWAAENGLLD
jgi:predicted nucleic acid-binding protein